MTEQVNKYRLWCITEQAYVEGWGVSAPSVCYNNNTHEIDAESITQIDSVADSDVTIKASDITLPSQLKGFMDLTGHNFYKVGKRFVCTAGEYNIFMEKFAANMYLAGGGYCIPETVYQSGTAVVQKPEDGDYAAFDFADIDNVLGYGKTASISKVSRSSNVVTVTTASEHSFLADEAVCVDCADDTFDSAEVTIVSVPSSTTFTFAQTGDDVAEKDASGSVGKIVVLGSFVDSDFIWPGKSWEILLKDAKLIPAGIYLRYKYYSTGTTDVVGYTWYNMRT